MFNPTYQSWLADRGVDSSDGQPRIVLAADIHPDATGLIVATSSDAHLEAEALQVQKLARALAPNDSHTFSWVLVAGDAPQIPVPVFRNLMPRLKRMVVMSDDSHEVSDRSFKSEQFEVAGRDFLKFTGPSLHSLNLDASLKLDFWKQLQAWAV